MLTGVLILVPRSLSPVLDHPNRERDRIHKPFDARRQEGPALLIMTQTVIKALLHFSAEGPLVLPRRLRQQVPHLLGDPDRQQTRFRPTRGPSHFFFPRHPPRS